MEKDSTRSVTDDESSITTYINPTNHLLTFNWIKYEHNLSLSWGLSYLVKKIGVGQFNHDLYELVCIINRKKLSWNLRLKPFSLGGFSKLTHFNDSSGKITLCRPPKKKFRFLRNFSFQIQHQSFLKVALSISFSIPKYISYS